MTAKRVPYSAIGYREDIRTFRGIRIFSGLSLRELAARLNTTPQIISQVERGESYVTDTNVRDWLRECGIVEERSHWPVHGVTVNIDRKWCAEWEPYAVREVRRTGIVRFLGDPEKRSEWREKILEMHIIRARSSCVLPTHKRPDRTAVVGVAIVDLETKCITLGMSPIPFADASADEWRDLRKLYRSEFVKRWPVRSQITLEPELLGDCHYDDLHFPTIRVFSGRTWLMSCLDKPAQKEMLRTMYRNYVMRKEEPPDMGR